MLDSQDRERYIRLDAAERVEFLRMHPAFWGDFLWFDRNRRLLYFRMERALRAAFLVMSDRERKAFETCSEVDRQLLISLVHERTLALRNMIPTLYEAYRQQLD